MTLGKKKGFAIIWTLITGSIMLLLATIMINATVKESKMVMNFAASTQVSNAAKSGVTWANWCINNKVECEYQSVPEGDVRSFMVDGIDITVRITDQIEGTDTVYYVDSLGSNDKVIRKFNYRYAPKIVTQVAARDVQNFASRSYFNLTPVHPNSASYSYSFWVNSANNTRTLTTYLYNHIKTPADLAGLTGGIKIEYRNNSNKPELILKSPLGSSLDQSIPLYNPENPAVYIDATQPFKVNITVNYIKNVNITLMVRILDSSDSLPDISYRKTVSALGIDYGILNRIGFDRQNVDLNENNPYINLGDYIQINLQGTARLYITNIEHWGNP